MRQRKVKTFQIDCLAIENLNPLVAWTNDKGNLGVDLLLRAPDGIIITRLRLFRITEVNAAFRVTNNTSTGNLRNIDFPTKNEAIDKIMKELTRRNVACDPEGIAIN